MVAKVLLGVLIGGCIGAGLGYFGKCSSGTCPLTANPYRGAIYGAVVGLLIAFTSGCSPGQESEKPKREKAVAAAEEQVEKPEEGKGEVVHIESEADFKERVLDAKGIFLVDLFSNQCPPCRILAPTISSLAEKYAGRVTVCKVDIDQARSVAERYKIRAIPTVLFIKHGKEVNRYVGLRSEAEYAAELDDMLGQP